MKHKEEEKWHVQQIMQMTVSEIIYIFGYLIIQDIDIWIQQVFYLSTRYQQR